MTDDRQKSTFEQDLDVKNKSEIPAPLGNLSKKTERIILATFFVVGFGVLLLGVAQFARGTTITWENVFGLEPGESLPEQQQVLFDDEYYNQISTDRSIDTDKDSLSDYDELQVYKTSPYLADSDSDGINDSQEIANGTDPNCPKGQECGFTTVENRDQSANGDDPDIAGGILDLNGSATQGASPIDQKLLSGDLSSDELRSILIQNGATAEILDQVDDQSLVEMYKQVLNETTAGSSGITSLGTPAPSNQELDALKNLTPDQIRELMINNGGDPNVLNQLSDEELVSVYNQTLQELLGE